jgi:ribosomal protein S18 acetylase RimI-like enzyme
MSDQDSSHSKAASEVQVRKAALQDVPALTEILVRAFDADPWMGWVLLKDERRTERATALMDWFIRRSMPHGHIYTTTDRTGTALWMPPGKGEMNLLQQLAFVFDLAPVTGLRRLPTRMIGLQAFQEKHPKQPHWYLALIGTDPSFQGKGIGSALMQPILQVCDEEGIPAYVETGNERNLPFYERYGFKVMQPFQFPFSGPQVWLMWREPD